MIKKTVRFYDLRMLPKDTNEPAQIESRFWSVIGDRVTERGESGWQIKVRSRVVHGEYRTCRQPARRYFYVGKVRPPSEWPDTLDSTTGVVANLDQELREKVLLEKTYVVPFGAQNRVAVLTMSQAAPRVSTLEDWFTQAAGMDPNVEQLTLVPILDKRAEELLAEAAGATLLRIVAEPHAELPDGGGEYGDAARTAKAVCSETDLTLKWSLGHRTGSASTRSELLRAARWARGNWAKSTVVSLQLPGDDGDGPRTEQIDLVTHYYTRTERFDITEGACPTEESVVAGITEAIEGFNRAHS